MSTTSPQAKEAGENAQWQSNLAQQLSNVALPELQALIGAGGTIPSMLSNKGANGQLGIDAAALKSSTDQLNRGYGQAGFGNQQFIGYNSMRSGEGRLSSAPANAMMQGAATSLERDRQSALANLNFMSAQSSMSDYNKLLGLMGQGVQTSMGLAQGFSGASNAALGGLSTQTQMGSALGGMSAGASLGAGIGSIVPGLGTIAGGVIGGVAGGAAGYFGGGG
jgi:hypothetical protein